MNEPLVAFAIDSTTSDVCEMDNAVRNEAKKTWLCPGCAEPRDGSSIPQITITGKVKNLALNFVYGVGFGVIRDDFLQLLRDFHVETDLTLVEMLDSDGNKISRFHAFRAKKQIIVRGGPGSSHRKCNVCGRLLYHPLGRWYILRKDWSEHTLSGDQFNGLIVPAEVASFVKEKKWKKTAITELPIFDEPKDNLK